MVPIKLDFNKAAERIKTSGEKTPLCIIIIF